MPLVFHSSREPDANGATQGSQSTSDSTGRPKHCSCTENQFDQLPGYVDQQIRTGRHQVLTCSESPGHRHRAHARRLRRLDVHRRISHKDGVTGISSHGVGQLQCFGRVRLSWRTIDVSATSHKRPRPQQRVADRNGEDVGLVGQNAHGHIDSRKGVERGLDSRVQSRFVEHPRRIGRLIALHQIRDHVRIVNTRHPSDQDRKPLTYQPAHDLPGHRRSADRREQHIGRIGYVVQRIGQRAVEIIYDGGLYVALLTSLATADSIAATLVSPNGLAYHAQPTMEDTRQRIGMWLIGASGGVGATVALGVAALGKTAADSTGLVTALPEFADAGLIAPERIVVGGHEIRAPSLLASVRTMQAESQVADPRLIDACAPDLRRMQRDIRPGIIYGSSNLVQGMADTKCARRVQSPAAAVEAVRRDIEAFRRRRRLDHVVVVNVASTESPIRPHAAHASYDKLAVAMRRKASNVLPASSIYALGAFAADCSYINFTPSAGMRIKAIEEFARNRDVLFMGRDGKTGETLMKSVLAPMFAARNLRIRSWVGHNILGNRDGEILNHPAVKRSKLQSKDKVVAKILGYSPDTRTSIEYLPSLADWKIAWDFVHFQGFLGTKMNLQFVWTGCDSMLAAPLVIDLVRLTALEFRLGRRGRMDHLACFFKEPYGVGEHGLFDQWKRLVDHVAPGAEHRGNEAGI